LTDPVRIEADEDGAAAARRADAEATAVWVGSVEEAAYAEFAAEIGSRR
jgi:hypothetical protein